MKRFVKVIVSMLTVVLLSVCCFAFSGCEQIKKLNFTVCVYNSSTQSVEEKILTIDLYRHLAPDTVDAIINKAQSGIYDNVIFYKITQKSGTSSASYSSQIMLGDLKWDDTNKKIVQNENRTKIAGEFAYTQGSNLEAELGTVGVWRTWYVKDGFTVNSKITDTNGTFDTSIGSLFFPTSSISSYNGYFSMIGKYDTSNTSTWSTIKTALDVSLSDYYNNYEIFFTGIYDSDLLLNNGLTFNSILKSSFEEGDYDDLFKAEKSDSKYECYNHYSIKVPTYKNDTGLHAGVYIKSVKVG